MPIVEDGNQLEISCAASNSVSFIQLLLRVFWQWCLLKKGRIYSTIQ